MELLTKTGKIGPNRTSSIVKRSPVRIGRVILTAALGAFAVIYLFPFFWMLLSSVKTESEVVRFPIVFFPSRITLENYRSIFTEFSFVRYLFNSVFLTSTVTLANLFTASLVGYVLAKFHFRAKNFIFLLLMAPMMIPFPVRLIPNYQIIVWFKWVDSYLALIVPQIFVTFTIFFV